MKPLPGLKWLQSLPHESLEGVCRLAALDLSVMLGWRMLKGSDWDEMRQRHSHEAALLSRVFAEVGREDEEGSVAGPFTCQLTMEPFREPVITPSGLSYERSALIDHLNKVSTQMSHASPGVSPPPPTTPPPPPPPRGGLQPPDRMICSGFHPS